MEARSALTFLDSTISKEYTLGMPHLIMGQPRTHSNIYITKTKKHCHSLIDFKE